MAEAPADAVSGAGAGDRDRIHLEPSWKARVGDYLCRPEMQQLSAFLRQRRDAGARIYPAARDIFAAFDATPFDAVKVVILGQDPYHGPGQAHGLCFSVQPGTAIPPSLDNMFKELQRDLGIPRPDNGCLLPWAKQGVLLLNAVLTVEEGRARAHAGKGWVGFTPHVVGTLARARAGAGVGGGGRVRRVELDVGEAVRGRGSTRDSMMVSDGAGWAAMAAVFARAPFSARAAASRTESFFS